MSLELFMYACSVSVTGFSWKIGNCAWVMIFPAYLWSSGTWLTSQNVPYLGPGRAATTKPYRKNRIFRARNSRLSIATTEQECPTASVVRRITRQLISSTESLGTTYPHYLLVTVSKPGAVLNAAANLILSIQMNTVRKRYGIIP